MIHQGLVLTLRESGCGDGGEDAQHHMGRLNAVVFRPHHFPRAVDHQRYYGSACVGGQPEASSLKPAHLRLVADDPLGIDNDADARCEDLLSLLHGEVILTQIAPFHINDLAQFEPFADHREVRRIDRGDERERDLYVSQNDGAVEMALMTADKHNWQIIRKVLFSFNGHFHTCKFQKQSSEKCYVAVSNGMACLGTVESVQDNCDAQQRKPEDDIGSAYAIEQDLAHVFTSISRMSPF